MCKAVLIAPFSEDDISQLLTQIPLGPAYLAAVMEKKGWEVKVIMPKTEYRTLSLKELIHEIESFSPEFIGFTLYTENILSMYHYIAELKSLHIPIVAGGHHPSICTYEVLKNGVDIAVRGEGEDTLVDLMEYFSGEIDREEILGISYKDKEGNIVDMPNRAPIEDLDSITFPARHVYENESNIRCKNDYVKFTALLGSRGCPFKCIYCNHRNLGPYRYRSPENIIKEITYLEKRYGLSYFAFQDSTFTVDRKHTIGFCNALIEGKKNIKWSCSTRLDVVDYELLVKMKEAGCILIDYGIESLNPNSLKKIKKNTSFELVDKVVNWMKDVGIIMNANFMWGFPWEKAEDIKENLIKVKNKSIYFDKIMPAGIPIPYPGRELYDDYKDEYGFENWWLDGKIKYCYNPHFYQSLSCSFQDSLIKKSFFNYSALEVKELKKVAHFIAKFNRRKLSKKRRLFIESLIFISMILSKISPWLEINIFQKVIFKLRYVFRMFGKQLF